MAGEGNDYFGQNDQGSISEEVSKLQTELKMQGISTSDGRHLGRGTLEFKGWRWELLWRTAKRAWGIGKPGTGEGTGVEEAVRPDRTVSGQARALDSPLKVTEGSPSQF